MSETATVGIFFFQAEDGIRDLVRSRGLGDVYKRQGLPEPGQQRPVLPLHLPGCVGLGCDHHHRRDGDLSLIHI